MCEAVEQIGRLAERWGFDLVSRDGATRLWGHLMRWGANVYPSGLIWAFNPASLQGEGPGKLRRDLLIDRYRVSRR